VRAQTWNTPSATTTAAASAGRPRRGAIAIRRRAAALAQVERQLRLEAAHLAHPGRLAELAAELGLQPPAIEKVIFLEETR
jgi:hypothetical protein